MIAGTAQRLKVGRGINYILSLGGTSEVLP